MDMKGILENNIPVLGISVAQLLTGILILVIGIFIVKISVLILKRALIKGKMPRIMADFLGKFISSILIILVFILALGAVGVDIGGVFIGLSAALGLIIAFGMQDTLNNMFAGIWIATLRPIKVDEVVEVKGLKGKVNGLNVMSTELLTPDNTYITLPNREVWGSPIINYSRMPIRRVDVDVGVSYSGDVSTAIETAMRMLRRKKMVLKDPAPDVVVTGLGDSSVDLQLRAWTKTDNYWTLRGWMTRKIKDVFDREGIEIPFPQVDVHMEK